MTSRTKESFRCRIETILYNGKQCCRHMQRKEWYLLFYLPHIILNFVHVLIVSTLFIIMNIFRCNRKNKRFKKKIAFGTVGILAVVYFFSKINIEPRFTFSNNDIKMACLLPDLDPFDNSIKQFDWHPDPLVCDDSLSYVFVDEQGLVQYNKTALNAAKISKLSCTYSIMHRSDGSDDYVTFSQEVPLTFPAYIQAEYFKVKCQNEYSETVFHSLLFNIDHKTLQNSKSIEDESQNHFSVFIFGIDAVSRLAAIRKLSKSRNYLLNDLGGYEFKGYMKHGDNTFPNVIGMLTGKEAFSSELPPLNKGHDGFDKYPFVWRNFSRQHYVTLFSEDYPDIAMFNLGEKPGFKNQPTDHYMRPFWRGLKKVDLADTLLDSVLIGLEDKKVKLRQKSSLCYGNTPKHKLSVEYMKQFVGRYKGKRRFSFTWLNEISHDYVNFLELGDGDFMELFKWMDIKGHLDRAFLFFVSDHGSRIDAIRNTFVGRIEERMPMFTVVVPKKFKDQFPWAVDVLKNNQERLTTHYDFYETLNNILLGDFTSKTYSKNIPRGISLFSEIPKHRSCADAGIPEHYCACYQSFKISNLESKVQSAADFIVKMINGLLKDETEVCEKLSLLKIHDAQKISLGLKHTGDVEFFSIRKYFVKPEKEKEDRYLILLETTPGNALFEATVKFTYEGKLRLLGQISRTNRYGKSSACVDNHLLHLYCYCRSQSLR